MSQLKTYKSNIGKQYLDLPSISILLDKEKNCLYFKGTLGIFKVSLSNLFFFKIDIVQNTLSVLPYTNTFSPFINSLWGTYRSLIANVLKGISVGFTQTLELVGLGYKATLQNKTLVLKLGKSHDIQYTLPKNMDVKFFSNNLISLRSTDLQSLRQVAFQIYKLKKPDPYKGKGIRIPGKLILRKEGKKQK